MSNKKEQPPESAIPEETRRQVAQTVSEQFMALSPQDRRMFVDETLTALVNMNRKQLGNLLKRLFLKKGPPSTVEMERGNQLIVTFLYAIKEEFRYHFVSMIFKNFPKMDALLAHTREKVVQIRELEPLHFLVSKPVAQDLYRTWEEQGKPEYDVFFNKLLHGEIARAKPKGGKSGA